MRKDYRTDSETFKLINVLTSKLQPNENYNKHEFFLLAQTGNRAIRDKILAYNIQLVMDAANSYAPATKMSVESLAAIATRGLYKAIDGYDYKINLSFAAYAEKCINETMMMFFKKQNKILFETMAENPPTKISAASINLTTYDNTFDLADTLEFLGLKNKHEIDIMLENAIANKIIRPRAARFVRKKCALVDGFEYTAREIAREEGIASKSVALTITRTMDKLKIYKYQLLKQTSHNDLKND